MNRLLHLCLVVVVLILTAACTDPTVIGGELIDGTQLPITYRDDIPVKMTTLLAENNSLSTGIQNTEEGVAVGCMASAYTGELSSRVGMQIVERDEPLNLTNATVDSVVLSLPMDIVFQLGDTMASSTLRVIGAAQGCFDNLEPTTSTPLLDNGVEFGEHTAVPGRKITTVNVFTADSIRVDSVGPEFRIPLNQAFRDALFPALARSITNDSTVNDSTFLLDFPGIIIEGSTCGSTLPAIDLSLAKINRMGVFIYYTTAEGVPRQYQLNYRRGATAVGTLRPEYIHDYVGSPASLLLVGGTAFDSTLAIVQSLSGLMVKVEFPELMSLNDLGVNAAFLDIPMVEGTQDVIRALPRILPRVRNSDGDLVDYSASASDGTSSFSLSEGGSIIKIPDPRSTTTDSVFAYRFNITTFFQDVIDGTRNPEFYLVARFQTQLPGESILVGPGGGATALRSRLLLATTELP